MDERKETELEKIQRELKEHAQHLFVLQKKIEEVQHAVQKLKEGK